MMMLALSFIRSNWRIFAITAAALTLLGAVWAWNSHERGIGRAEARKADAAVIAALRADLKTCQGNTQALTASLDAQNASITAAKADGDRRAKMLADGLQQARVGRASAEARAARLVSQAPVGGDACARSEAARAAVLEALK